MNAADHHTARQPQRHPRRRRTGLDQLTELLVDFDGLSNKCEPAERRILKRTLSTHITIDDEENATYSPAQTTAGVLAHTNFETPPKSPQKRKLPRPETGQIILYVDLGGFEPPTFSLRTRRATNCAIGP